LASWLTEPGVACRDGVLSPVTDGSGGSADAAVCLDAGLGLAVVSRADCGAEATGRADSVPSGRPSGRLRCRAEDPVSPEEADSLWAGRRVASADSERAGGAAAGVEGAARPLSVVAVRSGELSGR
jgi:hypothetical protein